MTLLTKHRDSLMAENPIMFSDKGDLLLYVEVTYGAIDRQAMYEFFVIDLKTKDMKKIKDWNRTITFYGMNW